MVEMALPANLRGRSKREWQQMRATACLAAEALEPVSDPPLPTGVTIDLSSLARPRSTACPLATASPSPSLDATAAMMVTRILEQCEPTELAPGLLSAPSRPETATALPRGEDSQGRLKHAERTRRKRAWNALLRAGHAAAADVSGV